jgi:hypothetical protein
MLWNVRASCFEINQEMDAILLIIGIVYGVCRIVIKSVQQCTYFLFSVNLLWLSCIVAYFKLCDKVCQWYAAYRWFSPGTPVYSTNKTDRHDITEALLKVELNIKTLTPFWNNNLQHLCNRITSRISDLSRL